MATVESPDCVKRYTFSTDTLETIAMHQSVDLPSFMNTESLVEQKSDSTSEEVVDNVASAQKPSAVSDSFALTAPSEDAADQAPAEAKNHEGGIVKEDSDNKVYECEQRSHDWPENEGHAEGLHTGEGKRNPKQDLSSVPENVGEAECKTNVTSEVSEPEMSKMENSTEKEHTQREKSVEQKEKADGKDDEEINPAEELSKQPKKRRMMCKECGKIFNRRETFNLHRHFHLHEDELKPLTCKECGLTFQQRSSFVKHRNEHKENGNKPISVKKGVVKEEQGAFKCAECATVFFSLTKLRNHRCNHSDDVPFHCPICRQDFMYKVAITRHIFTHSKERLQCTECDQTFSDPMSLRTHQHSHVFHKPYKCADCGMAFRQYSLMVDHRRKHTENSVSFPCNVCGKSFKYIGLLHQHQYLHTGKKPFICSECGKTFAFAQNLKSHYRQHSLNIISTEKPKTNHCNSGQTSSKKSEKENMVENNDVVRTYNCPLCDQSYTTPANLRTHIDTHEAEYEMTEGSSKSSKESMKSDKAHDSPDIFSDKFNLNVHAPSVPSVNAVNILPTRSPEIMDDVQENSDRIRPFKCPDCEKSFQHQSVLDVHKRIHSKDTYQCKVCNKRFSMSSYLQQHMLIHTGKKPYKCSHCGKDFAYLHSMKTHQKLHQEKPFRCSYCRKGYSDEVQLQHHMLSHNGEKPHKCNICDKRFGLACLLRDHMNTHTGDRPHHCEVCNKSFTWLSSLLVHQKNAHKRRNTNLFNSFPLGDRVTDNSVAVSDICLSLSSDTPARDAETDQKSEQPSSMDAIGIDLKKKKKPVVSEPPPPVQWKVDRGELLPAASIPQTRAASQTFDNPSLSRLVPGQIIMESSLSYVSPGSTVVPKKLSPSSALENEQQRQVKSVPWSSPPSAVTSINCLQTDFAHSGSYVDGTALWSVKPTAPNLSTHSTPTKPSQEVQFPTWQGAPLLPQTDHSITSKKEEKCAWAIGNPHVQTINPEKSWAPDLQSASSLVQIPAHGIRTRWDVQTGLQQTLNSSDRLVTNPDFHLQQKQVSPSWVGVQTTAPNVPISIQYDPHRFSQAIGAPLWGFQSNPVDPQTMLKSGNVREMQQIATGTKIILNQPPPFFPLPAMALPASHPLHSVPVGALASPPHPNIFFPPQAVTQTLSLPQLSAQSEHHKLGPHLTYAPDRLHQCMICGCSLPREVDLQMHYIQHAQGKI